MRKLILKEFVEKANFVHNNKFDYSAVIYINSRTKIKISCPIHGEFLQYPSAHLKGAGCKKCGHDNRRNMHFIEKASLIHNNRYDYSKVIYIKNKTKVCIVCPAHGDFFQRPSDHLKGHGCSICSGNQPKTMELFINEANHTHNNKYDYSAVNYVGAHKKINIICSKHGMFLQSPHRHLRGEGCPKCSKNISKKSQKWLDSFNNPNIIREKFLLVGRKKFFADGYDPITNTVYEFYGDFWHGNPKKFKSNDINWINKKPFGELYEQTLEREKYLISCDFCIKSIWEVDFDNICDLK